MTRSTEMVPLQGTEVLDRIQEILLEIGENIFELGAHLYETKHAELYKERDFTSWEAWCDIKLPFQYRKADHYIELWELYHQKLGYDWGEIRHVGWSKLIKVKGLIETKRDAKKWIGRCEKHGRRAIEKMVAAENAQRAGLEGEPSKPPVAKVEHDLEGELAAVGDTDLPFVDPNILGHERYEIEDDETGEEVPLHELKFFLFQEQWANVMSALERASHVANSKKPGHLLDVICTEFVTAFAETADGGVAHSLEAHRQNLERLYGVEIEINVPAGSKLRVMSRLDEPKAEVSEEKEEKDPQFSW